MPNYTLVADTTFKNRSFDDLIRPFQMYTEVYNQMADSINELDTKASVWEGMANEQSDPVAYAQYKRYADELRTQAKLIATNGTSPSTRQDVLNLRRRYASEIAPIENAYTTRKEQAAEQRKALNADPTLLLSRRADATSLDDYLANPTLGYESYSGAVLASQVGNAAKALAKELKNYGNGKRLDAYTKTWIEQHGFTAEEVAHAINNPDDPKSSKVLRTLVDNVMADSGIHRWADYPTLNQAYNYARQGLWEAVGVDNVHPYEDYGARLDAKVKAERKEAEDTEKRRVIGLAINPINIYNSKERNLENAAPYNIEKYGKYFTTDTNGNVVMTEAGKTEYYRNAAPKTNAKVPTSGSGTAALMNTETQMNAEIRGKKHPFVPTEFRKFIDNLTGGKDLSNVGNLWVDYQNRNAGVGLYDATKTTEFDYRVDKPADQKAIKGAILTAARGTELQEVDFDAKTNTFKPAGDSLSMSELGSDDYTVLATRFSPYGSTVMISDKNGEVHRYNMPKDINPTNEINRDRAMQKALSWQQVITTGRYTDANGNEHMATPDEITYAQNKYSEALQEAYMYQSQLWVTNTTDEQQFKPYGY